MSDESNTVRSHLTLTDEGAETLLAAMGKPLPAKLAALVAERRAARPSDWDVDCMQLRGRVLSGEHAHWCVAWDFLPIDETCDGEWPCSCDVGRAASRLAALEAVAEAAKALPHCECVPYDVACRRCEMTDSEWVAVARPAVGVVQEALRALNAGRAASQSVSLEPVAKAACNVAANPDFLDMADANDTDALALLSALGAVAEAVRGLDFTHTESCSLKMTYRKQANSGKPWPCTCGMAALTAAMTSVR